MTEPAPVPVSVRALVLVDQPLVARTIELTLNHGAFITREAAAVAEAEAIVASWQPQLAIVDMDIGAPLLTRIGRFGESARIPVLGLTRRGDLKTKLAAFEQGVDDILTVPFSPEELLARSLVIATRAHGVPPPRPSTIRIGDLELDILNRRLRAGGHDLHLTGLEQSLLYLLAANAGQVLTRDEILDAIWGADFVAESNVVDRHIRALRAKLQNDWRRPRFIETVAGQGYRFVPHTREQESPS